MLGQSCVQVLRTVPELEQIREWWESCSGERDSDMSVYLEFVEANPACLCPHVVVSYENGHPDAILVGRIDSVRFPFRIGYWRFGGPRIRMLTLLIGAQRGNPSPAASEVLFRKALESLKQGEADVIRLQYAPIDSELFRLGRALPAKLARDYFSIPVPHWFMDLPSTSREILEGMSGDFRRKLKQKAKRLQADFGTPELRLFCSPENVEDMLRDVERIAAKSYQRKIGAGFHDTALTRQMILSHAGKGWLLGYVLYVRSEPIAYWVGCLYQGVFCSDYIGYDPDFGQYSPGTELEVRVFEDLCARKARQIDLGLGDYRWKQRLGTSLRQDADLYVFRTNIPGLVLNSAYSGSVAVNQSLKYLLNRVGALSRIKAAWGGKGKGTAQGETKRRSAGSGE